MAKRREAAAVVAAESVKVVAEPVVVVPTERVIGWQAGKTMDDVKEAERMGILRGLRIEKDGTYSILVS